MHFVNVFSFRYIHKCALWHCGELIKTVARGNIIKIWITVDWAYKYKTMVFPMPNINSFGYIFVDATVGRTFG